MLAKMYRIPRIQHKDYNKFNKQKGPSKHDSVPLRRRNKIIKSGESWAREVIGKRNGNRISM